MGAADMLLFGLLALADAALLTHLHRRRQRRYREQRMMRCLRIAIQREQPRGASFQLAMPAV